MTAAQFPMHSQMHALYRDHHGWLQGWLRRRLGSAADAADLAHDAFLRLIIKPAPRGFATAAEARGYLRTMAGGLCINLWHRREIEQAWLDTLAARPEEYAPSAERQAIVLEALHEIGRLLLGVSPRASRAFLMSAVCGMPAREVAAALGVSTRMVRKHVAQVMLRCLQAQACQTARDLNGQALP